MMNLPLVSMNTVPMQASQSSVFIFLMEAVLCMGTKRKLKKIKHVQGAVKRDKC